MLLRMHCRNCLVVIKEGRLAIVDETMVAYTNSSFGANLTATHTTDVCEVKQALKTFFVDSGS